MSNPGVIVLERLLLENGPFKRFEIEDNIGEAIHIHMDQFRLDLSLEEFMALADVIESSLSALDCLVGESILHYDMRFLKDCAPFLDSLESIKDETIQLSECLCIVEEEKRPGLLTRRLLPIQQTPAYKMLQMKTPNDRKHDVVQSLEQRLTLLNDALKTKPYEESNQKIVLFNQGNIIRDGQHRAAILAHWHGLDFKVSVKRFYFKGDEVACRLFIKNNKAKLKWLLKKLKKVFN